MANRSNFNLDIGSQNILGIAALNSTVQLNGQSDRKTSSEFGIRAMSR
jgi:hypothetical protein